MKVTTSAIIALLFLFNGNSQILFTESFNEANGSTTGSDNTNSVNWTALCPGSVATTDYFNVQNGRLEARDTNGPAASWTTNDIDITSCNSVEISFSISESGTMEACGTGCVSADFIAFEYSIDGGAWTSPANSYSCGGSCPPSSGRAIADDDVTSVNYATGCISLGGGSSLRLRIEAQCWAGSEYWRIDDVLVSCDGCSTLPIELTSFEAKKKNDKVILEWETATELNNDYFTVERSLDVKNWQEIAQIDGAGSSQEPLSYDTLDRAPLKGTSYYRLKQTDFDGSFSYSDIRSVNFEAGASVLLYPNPAKTTLTIQGESSALETIKIFNTTGQDVTERVTRIVSDVENIVFDLTTIPSGVYFVKTKESAYKVTKL
ncbi:MAG: hypothetical protein Crog4KO_25090 [Crocinitomicaceae bacterium]